MPERPTPKRPTLSLRTVSESSRCGRAAVTLLATWLLAGLVAAHPTPRPTGGAFQVNSYTTGAQALPAVASSGDAGDFVIVWESDGAEDASVKSILAQRFDSQGQPRGSEFRASFSTAADNSNPDVAMQSNGEFVVVWTGPTLYGEVNVGRRFASDGSPIGGVFTTSDSTSGQPGPPSVAYLPDGSFFVAWAEETEIFSRRFDSGGIANGQAFQVNNYTAGTQSRPDVAAINGDELIIVWDSDMANVAGGAVFGKRFTSEGQSIGGDLTLTFGGDRRPDVAPLESGFALGFVFEFFDPRNIGRRYSSTGTGLSREFGVCVRDPPITDCQAPRVGADPFQDVTLAWSQSTADGSEVHLKSFDLDEPPDQLTDRPTLAVETIPSGDQDQPALAPVGDRMLVVWRTDVTAGNDGDLGGIQARFFELAFFTDGFESGDTSAWSFQQP